MSVTERVPTVLAADAAPTSAFRRWLAPATFLVIGLIDIFVLGLNAHQGDATFTFSQEFAKVTVPNLTLPAAVTCYVCGAITIAIAAVRAFVPLNAALRRVLGEATLIHVVRDERATLMARVREQLNDEARDFGIKVVDVRIRRADLPEQNSQAVYSRMQTERQRQAASIRGEGNQKSQEIRAKADRDVTVIVAEAQSRGGIPFPPATSSIHNS